MSTIGVVMRTLMPIARFTTYGVAYLRIVVIYQWDTYFFDIDDILLMLDMHTIYI